MVMLASTHVLSNHTCISYHLFLPLLFDFSSWVDLTCIAWGKATASGRYAGGETFANPSGRNHPGNSSHLGHI